MANFIPLNKKNDMKGKILNALKTKYSNLGFGDKAFDGVASYLSGSVTEESQIETAIAGVESLLKSFQGEADKVRGEKSNLQKELDELKKKSETKPNETTKDEEPEWAKKLRESFEGVTTKVAQFEQQTAAEKRNTEIIAKAKEYGIPENFISRLNISQDANLDDYMKEVKQEFANIGFEGVKSPDAGGGDQKTDSEEIAAAIAKGTKEIVEQKK